MILKKWIELYHTKKKKFNIQFLRKNNKRIEEDSDEDSDEDNGIVLYNNIQNGIYNGNDDCYEENIHSLQKKKSINSVYTIVLATTLLITYLIIKNY